MLSILWQGKEEAENPLKSRYKQLIIEK